MDPEWKELTVNLYDSFPTVHDYDVMDHDGNVAMRMRIRYAGRTAGEIGDSVSCFVGRMMGLAEHLFLMVKE